MKQIQDVINTRKPGRSFAFLFAMMLALAAFANADSMHSHKAKKGSLKITAPTEIGGVTLQPGDYEFKEKKSADGPVMEIVHLFDNFTAPEGYPVHDYETVGEVKVTEQTLNSAPKQTQLELAPNTAVSATALEIRGDNVEYLFAPSQSAEQAEAAVGECGH